MPDDVRFFDSAPRLPPSRAGGRVQPRSLPWISGLRSPGLAGSDEAGDAGTCARFRTAT
jgi:hypothetical protein